MVAKRIGFATCEPFMSVHEMGMTCPLKLSPCDSHQLSLSEKSKSEKCQYSNLPASPWWSMMPDTRVQIGIKKGSPQLASQLRTWQRKKICVVCREPQSRHPTSRANCATTSISTKKRLSKKCLDILKGTQQNRRPSSGRSRVRKSDYASFPLKKAGTFSKTL